MTVTHHIESDVHPLRCADARVDFVFQPVFRNFLLHHFHVPGITRTEIPASAGEAEASLGAVFVECAVGSADRTALAEGNYVVGFLYRLGLWLLLEWRWSSACGLVFAILSGIGIASGSFSSRFRLGQ